MVARSNLFSNLYDIGGRPARTFQYLTTMGIKINKDNLRGCQPNLFINKEHRISIADYPLYTTSTLAEAISANEISATDTCIMVDVLYHIKNYDLYRAVVRCRDPIRSIVHFTLWEENSLMEKLLGQQLERKLRIILKMSILMVKIINKNIIMLH